jgi:NTE family protein
MQFWQQLFKKKKQKVGLCFSGGGLRGIAHIGTIKAVEEKGIKIDYISGTSAGAIIGALYSFGYTADELMKIVEESTFFSRKMIKISSGGLFNPDLVKVILQKYLPVTSFESLPIPLFVAATNINQGNCHIFSKGSLFSALVASSSIPYVFPSLSIEGSRYCDGGLVNNLPIEPLIANNCKIIASHVNATETMDMAALGKLSARNLMARLFNIGVASHVYQKKEHCDCFIEAPGLTKYSLFDKKNANQLFDMGYQYAKSALENWK